ncbi:hypothetical protein [Crossiella sp. NPDC003009]
MLLADRVVVFALTGHLAADHQVDLPHPRTFDDLLVSPLADVVHAVRRSLTGQDSTTAGHPEAR